jgi:hypothetical protein
LHYNLEDFKHIKRGNGNMSKRYKHWCLLCLKDRGYAYKNKILKERLCLKCKMQQPEVLAKISKKSKQLRHTSQSKAKISNSLHTRYGSNIINKKIANNLRGRLSQAIKNNYKSGSAVRDLGCSIDELRQYLESKFQPGMSWNNHGRTGWHIDHIRPLCSFDLADEIQLKEACNYNNLQPLWAKDNLNKRHIDGTFR